MSMETPQHPYPARAYPQGSHSSPHSPSQKGISAYPSGLFVDILKPCERTYRSHALGFGNSDAQLICDDGFDYRGVFNQGRGSLFEDIVNKKRSNLVARQQPVLFSVFYSYSDTVVASLIPRTSASLSSGFGTHTVGKSPSGSSCSFTTVTQYSSCSNT